MLSLLVALASLLLVPFVAGSPSPDGDPDWRGHKHHCVTDREAAALVPRFQELYRFADQAVADEILTDDFHEYSDSVNWIIFNATKPPGAPVHTSKAEFLATWQAVQAATGPGEPFEPLNIWHSCHTISFRWISRTRPYPLIGVDVLELHPKTHKIQNDYAELNTAALLANAGCSFDCPA
ncbi:hypothetical protein W97_00349 [Coniosporium apollinis CBS 100218]|uniref:NTF2-like domain-containing protein n=1 Tax=Coniosporium apollinis (strain CBS 100218) TaxID=1168221 RepID=R7YGY6_CONA1|nr:uncharacterized protein W97_00349 [Coniosporium apollinis CBS 100218]EON61138.1 hypothetical protein W97_00349 [Coniosporium apollinis CBS 100218]